MGREQVPPLRVRVGLGVMAMNGLLNIPRVSGDLLPNALKCHTEDRFFFVRCNIFIRGLAGRVGNKLTKIDDHSVTAATVGNRRSVYQTKQSLVNNNYVTLLIKSMVSHVRFTENNLCAVKLN